MSDKMVKLTYKEKYEAYRARIDSESYHKLSLEQEKQGEKKQKKICRVLQKTREEISTLKRTLKE